MWPFKVFSMFSILSHGCIIYIRPLVTQPMSFCFDYLSTPTYRVHAQFLVFLRVSKVRKCTHVNMSYRPNYNVIKRHAVRVMFYVPPNPSGLTCRRYPGQLAGYRHGRRPPADRLRQLHDQSIRHLPRLTTCHQTDELRLAPGW